MRAPSVFETLKITQWEKAFRTTSFTGQNAPFLRIGGFCIYSFSKRQKVPFMTNEKALWGYTWLFNYFSTSKNANNFHLNFVQVYDDKVEMVNGSAPSEIICDQLIEVNFTLVLVCIAKKMLYHKKCEIQK